MIEQLPLILLVVAAYLLAGFVKGVIGMGLPTVALGVLATVTTPAQAAAILIAPSLATNIWQMLAGPYLAALIRRLGPMISGVAAGAWLGAGILTGDNARIASLGLGLALVSYSALGLCKVQFAIGRKTEHWLGPLVGVATGFVLSATGIFVVPALPYLQAIGMEKDELVQGLGLHFTAGTFILAAVLWSGGSFSVQVATLSLFAILPAVLGMYAGQIIRRRVSVDTFRLCLFAGLLLLGLHLVVRNLL